FAGYSLEADVAHRIALPLTRCGCPRTAARCFFPCGAAPLHRTETRFVEVDRLAALGPFRRDPGRPPELARAPHFHRRSVLGRQTQLYVKFKAMTNVKENKISQLLRKFSAGQKLAVLLEVIRGD